MRKIPSLFCAAALLAGCATGQKFSLDRASQVHVGMTTNELVQVMGCQPLGIAQVKIDVLGKPLAPEFDRYGFGKPSGLENWVWSYDTGFKRDLATFVIADGKVVLVPSSVAKSRAELERQSVSSKGPVEQLLAERQAANAAAKKKADEDKKAEFVRSHKELPEAIRESVLAGQVCIGMPAEALELSWGRPFHKQKTTGRLRTSEIWSYTYNFHGTSVFLDDGKVSGWHTSD